MARVGIHPDPCVPKPPGPHLEPRLESSGSARSQLAQKEPSPSLLPAAARGGGRGGVGGEGRWSRQRGKPHNPA